MIQMFYLITIANQFLIDRNWVQFHNPKNDAMNIIVEVGELAEYFISTERIITNHEDIKNEMADVFFALITFSQIAKIDIAHAVGKIVNDNMLKDETASYQQLHETVLKNKEKFNLHDNMSPGQVVLSLVNQASQLSDLFVWLTSEQSIIRAQEKYSNVEEKVAHILAHLIFLSSLINIHVPTAYLQKMLKNGAKYPTDTASAEKYIQIKDKARGRH